MRVVVLGGGPIGLEFCAAALEDGMHVTLIERGNVGENVRKWGHVDLFSTFELNCSDLGLNLLQGRIIDPAYYPTGNELCDHYLVPLFHCLKAKYPSKFEVLLQHSAVSCIKESVLKHHMTSARVIDQFSVLVVQTETAQERILGGIDFIVDATGTFGNRNYFGAGGGPALGELSLLHRGPPGVLRTDIPDAAGVDAKHYLGKRVCVIGSGYSAITSVHKLLQMAREQRKKQGQEHSQESHHVHIEWVTRHSTAPYKRLPDDPLPQRDALCALANALAAGSNSNNSTSTSSSGPGYTLTYHPFRQVKSVQPGDDDRGGGDVGLRVRLVSCGPGGGVEGCEGEEELVVDRIISNTGFRPDHSLSRELHVHQCYASEGPMALSAAMLASAGGQDGSGEIADCLAQVTPGATTLRTPEPGFFIIGSKSYGRNSSFLLRVGREQVGHVMTLIREQRQQARAAASVAAL